MTTMTPETFAVVTWALLGRMTASQIDEAADHLESLPVAEQIPDLLVLMREEAEERREMAQ